MPSGELQFAVRLFEAMPRDTNLVFSPTSARMALVMAAAGACGDTAAEMHSVLGLADGAAGNSEIAEALTRWAVSNDRKN
jgi:serine protease inhibitor